MVYFSEYPWENVKKRYLVPFGLTRFVSLPDRRGQDPALRNIPINTIYHLNDVAEKKSRLLQGGSGTYRTYSMTTQRLGSTPVEWVVMLSISWRAA